MSAVVVFCSQTGSAEKYAQWLAEDLNCSTVPLSKLENTGATADLVILCSWFHAASIKGAKKFKAFMTAHPEKHFAVVAVGATPMPCDEWPEAEHEEAFHHSFPADVYVDLPWVYCLGSFHLEQLGMPDRIMMHIYFKMLEDEVRKGSTRSQTALDGMRAGFNGCNRTYLTPLIDELRERNWI